MRWALLAVLAGCYAPSVPEGAACDATHGCPERQQCEIATGSCQLAGGGPDGERDAASDGSIDGPVDAGLECDPDELEQAGVCVVPVTEVPPHAVPATSGCELQPSNAGHAIAYDAAGHLYLAMRCGANATFTLASSSDGGHTIRTTATFELDDVQAMAVTGAGRKVAYAAGISATTLVFAVTRDGGTTWDAQRIALASAPSPSFGISVVEAADRAFVAFGLAGMVRVYRSLAGGALEVASDVPFNFVFGDLMIDRSTNTLWLGGDTPALHLRSSTTLGSSWTPEVVAAGSHMFSDWALGDGVIAAVGSDLAITRISTSTPSIGSDTSVLAPAASRMRAIAVADDGMIYVATQPSSSSSPVTVERFPTTAPPQAFTFHTDGGSPALAIGPDTAAAYLLSGSGSVVLGVHKF